MSIGKKKLMKMSGSAAALALFLFLLFILFWPNTRKRATIIIQHDTEYEQLIQQLDKDGVLKSMTTFRLTGKMLFYKKVKPGKYAFDKGSSNFSMIYKLRRGQHFPVRFSFTAARTKDLLVKKLSRKEFFFEWDELRKLLDDSLFLKQYGLTPETSIAVFMPNTYEFYYDITAAEFFGKIYSYYAKFWNSERAHLAEQIGLTPLEVITLASIVEEENYRDFEKPTIAGLYMNRLHKEMRLQSDPTVKFALGDFTLTRILHEHLKVDSPYNTYKYKGLPPGPIRTPSASSIDAVLHYEHNNYLYMCAKEDFSGAHNFTDSYQQHLKNAKKYQKALDARKK